MSLGCQSLGQHPVGANCSCGRESFYPFSGGAGSDSVQCRLRIGNGVRMPEIGNIKLGGTMVHEVPRGSRRANPDGAVILSKDLTPLDPNTDRFIRDQMLAPFIPGGRDIVAVPDPAVSDGNPGLALVPSLVKEMLADPDTLPEHSRTIAEHMFASQVGAASAGIFMASVGECGHGPSVIIMKAEHQEGVRMRHQGAPGSVSFDVEHIGELIVGKNSKVYKIAMLWVRDDGAVVGKMVDKQNGVAYADYFLHEFLGMDLRFNSEKLTRDLMDSATKHINANVDPDKKVRYTRALVALLESPNDEVNTTQFLTQFIDPEDRDDFAAALPPEVRAAFRKDTTLVKSRIGGIVLDLQEGEVQVRATRNAFDNGGVEVDPEKKQVVIKGLPDDISPSGPPK
ncbi:nucleoid-associated protein [Nocardioides nematodiphilus]|uniref:nucleoid-associated protein n=1 Tax=Nocardioides nematodiphilus TaxID=2849669 RepID=UPI001CD99215|nr:nucleoid-associated protein [Nocardioides nematodiphilus]MCA1982971.1 nucleoid-associated protein [Nocardioides nematodiphilus]